jgi:hypothetical protein
MKPATTDLSFFKKFKIVGKKSHGNAGPQGLLAAKDGDASDAKKPESSDKKDPGETEVLDTIVKNPHMNASTFYNVLKSQGLKIVRESNRIRESNKAKNKSSWMQRCSETFKKAKTKEADSAGSNAQVLRARESVKLIFRSRQFKESAASDNGIGHTKFRVVILQEGMGNLKDGYYYSREAIKSAVPVFEGKKIYADHPTDEEEKIRPERSVRDVLGHFENVEAVEGEGGQMMLEADVCILPEEEWARARMRHAVEYSKKYPDKDFIGLSINAGGESEPRRMADVIDFAPEAAKRKLVQAQEMGMNEVEVVTSIKEAKSADLVTEAGAGGKILEMLEKETANG